MQMGVEDQSDTQITGRGWSNIGKAVSMQGGFLVWLGANGVAGSKIAEFAAGRAQVILNPAQMVDFYVWYWAAMSAIGASLYALSRRR